jgi:hypothetical protein
VGPTVLAIIWLAKNGGRLREVFLLTFRRSRVVCARFHLPNGNQLDHFTTLRERSMFRGPDGGVYHFPKMSERGTRYNVPVADFLETQIPAEAGKVVLQKLGKLKVPVLNADGSRGEEERDAEQWMVQHMGLKPRLLQLARMDEDTGKVLLTDEPPVASREVADMLDSGIVEEINASTVDEAGSGRAVKTLLFVLIGMTALAFIVTYVRIGNLENAVSALQAAQAVAAQHAAASIPVAGG